MIESFIEFGKATEKVATALGDLAQALDVVSQTPCFTTPPWKENPSVMISINPKWCELIASGEKTVEVRKTRPKLDTPFKVYIYCTKQKVNGEILLTYDKKVEGRNRGFRDKGDIPLAGKVIGEFVCDKVFDIYEFSGSRFWLNETLVKATCLTEKEINNYGKGKDIFGWHISDLVIYGKPKELREFKKPCKETNLCYPDNCNRCGWNILLRPPQSWCYVEKLEDT